MNRERQSQAQDYLDEANLKHTAGRIAVLDTLLEARKPLTIEEIETKVKGKAHTVTLYRMLRQFVEKGIVYQTDLRTGKAYYELQDTHHHHITCTSCGQQEGVSVCASNLEQSVKKEAKKFKDIHSHTLEFFGICDKCTVRETPN